MLKITLITLAVLAIGFAIVAAMQPSEFRVTRGETINAPVEKVFAQVNAPRNWKAWSPWVKFDPEAQFTYEGPEAGVGGITKWSGNNKIGEGSSTVVESRKNEFIKFRLEFVRPMKAVNTSEFTFKPEGKQTLVTWTMYGPNNFIGKAMGLIMNCQKMVGDQFAEGLQNLKAVAEKK